MDHMEPSRPGAGRYWALKPLWDSGCYSLADVAVSVPQRAPGPRAAMAVASPAELEFLRASRGLPRPGAPLLGAALANLANWVRESPEPDLPGRAKSTGGKSLKDREFRATLLEQAKGPHTTNGALHWRMQRPHVPSTFPDRTNIGGPEPPTFVPTGRRERRCTAPDGPEFTGHIVSGPPAESADDKFRIHWWDLEKYDTARRAKASIKRQQGCGYKVASKTAFDDGSVHVQWQDSEEVRDSLNEGMLNDFYTRAAPLPTAPVVTPLTGTSSPD